MNIEQTVVVRERIEHSVIGSATMGAAFANVEAGRTAPLIRNGEDAEGLGRCTFLDPTIPIEMNILAVDPVRKALDRNDVRRALGESIVASADLLGPRPTLAYVPPEVWVHGDERELQALASLGDPGYNVGPHFRGGQTLAGWNTARQDGSLGRFISAAILQARGMGMNLFVPPTLAVTPNLATSAVEQLRINASAITPLTSGRSLAGELGAPDAIGILYPVHLDTAALGDADLIKTVVASVRRGLDLFRGKVWGVHIHFTDIGAVTKDWQRVRMAKDFVTTISEMANNEFGLFVWCSDMGPAAPAILDAGATFASSHTGVTPKRIYGQGGPGDMDSQCGKVLGLWEYNMFSRAQVRSRGDQLDETGLFPHAVPPTANASPKKYRVEWGRPRNVSVMERINTEREKELRAGNGRTGLAQVARSTDGNISPWA